MKYRILGVAFLALAFGALSVDAQGTKKKAEPAGSIELYKNDDGDYRYRIKSAEGKTIAMPLPQMKWAKKADALAAIEQLKAILNGADPVEVKNEPKTDTKKAADTKKATTTDKK